LQIVVVDDQYVVVDREKDVPQDNDSDEDFDDSETDDEYDDDEEDRWRKEQQALLEGSPLGGKKRRRRVRRKGGNSSEEDGDSEEERLQQAAPGSLARQKLPRAMRKHRWKAYYGRGTFRGQPVSYSMWQLVTHLHLERNDMLWLAIVGVTYAKLQSKLEADLYMSACDMLERAVLVLNDPGRADRPGPVSSATGGGRRGGSSAIAAGLPAALAGGLVQGQAAVFDENGELVQAAGSSAAAEVDPLVDGVAVMPAARLGFIRATEELNLFLHRHSTLFEAMRLSPYLGPRLKLWANDDDDRQLKKLLASSNVPLKDALTPWPHMKGRSKAAVMAQLVPTAQSLPTAQLDDLLFRSFTQQVGYASPIGAADVAYAAAALIECAHAQTITRAEEDARSNGDALAEQQQAAGGGDVQGRSTEAGGPQEELSWRDNFWTAYEALSGKPALVQRGIDLAQEIQRSIVRLGPYLVRTTHHFTLHGAVRTCKLAELKDSDRAIFTQPEALCRLGRFLIDHFQKVKGQWDRTPGAGGVTAPSHIAKPLVMLALNAETSYYTVVGLPVASRDEEDTSAFSQLAEVMRTAGQEAGARFVMDTFDSSCVWLHKNYVDAFLDQLCFRVVQGYDATANVESRLNAGLQRGGGSRDSGDEQGGGESSGDEEGGGQSVGSDDGAEEGGQPEASSLNVSGSTGASPESTAAAVSGTGGTAHVEPIGTDDEDLSEAAVLALLEQLESGE